MANFEKMDLDHEAYFITDEAATGAAIWNQVCQSEFFGDELSTFLKEVTYGSRSYTSIDAYQQIRKATEIFGPFGIGWGVHAVRHLASIPTIKKTKDETINGTQIFFEVTMFCVRKGFGEGKEHHTTPLIQDIFVDSSGDCGKKMITDCITKFLSYLGFNFDVFCGRFDGAKVAGFKSKEEDIVELKSLINELLPDKAESIIDYHTRRDWRKGDVASDLEKLRALKQRKAEANAETENG